MIHVSCFEDKSKNITGFLRAVKTLSGKRNDFECMLVGEGPDLEKMKLFSSGLGLGEETVKFTGLRQGSELVEAYRSADFLVLNSRYETFGTVVIEAMSCGLPVVTTRVGIVPEVVDPGNGIVVEPGDDSVFTDAIDKMLDTYNTYDSERIRASVVEVFSQQKVSDLLYQVYQEFVL